ncbi:inactive dipeptidyl peptidase 10-like, partial [Mustelus asterias]
MLVIGLISSMVIVSIILLSPEEPIPSPRQMLTLEDLNAPEFQIHDPQLKWAKGDEVIFRTLDGDVIRQNVVTRKVITLVGRGTFLSLKATGYQVSADLNYVLLSHNVTQIYRHSYTASYTIYNVLNGECLELMAPEVQGSTLQYAAWGTQGSQL